MLAPVERGFRLRDGRRLAYHEFGDANGSPLIYFHGFPSCGLEAAMSHPVASRRNIRVIAIDRPGLGGSSFKEKREIGDLPADVVELADALDIGRFSVMGVSGGGPYALACARYIPERLRSVGVVSGLGPTDGPAGTRNMVRHHRLAFRLSLSAPWVLRLLYASLSGVVLHSPERLLLRLAPTLSEEDRAVFSKGDLLATLIGGFRAAGKNGSRGIVWELSRYARPWSFDPQRIEMPVRLWHGTADRVVPCGMGRHVAEMVPHCRAEFVDGAGHFSLVVTRMERILAGLAVSSDRPFTRR